MTNDTAGLIVIIIVAVYFLIWLLFWLFFSYAKAYYYARNPEKSFLYKTGSMSSEGLNLLAFFWPFYLILLTNVHVSINFLESARDRARRLNDIDAFQSDNNIEDRKTAIRLYKLKKLEEKYEDSK
jgi:hypothetical protein